MNPSTLALLLIANGISAIALDRFIRWWFTRHRRNKRP